MYYGYITTLKELRKHSDADRLQCATVFGNNVIVDLSYKEGQKVVFFPTDGQLSEKFAEDNNLVRKKDKDGNNIGGYLDPNKRNITAIRLRGEKSEGLVMPIEVLSKYTDIAKLKDGDQVTELNGQEICRKYIPVKKGRQYSGGNSNREEYADSYPHFVQHIETGQLAFNQNKFKPGDTCYITLKMHGTSARTANVVKISKKKKRFGDRVVATVKKLFRVKEENAVEYGIVSGTRRTTLHEKEGKFPKREAFRQKYHEYFRDKLPKGVEVFYEIVGWVDEDITIMGRCANKLIKDKEFTKQYGAETVFSYGCNQGDNDCFVYRMTMTNQDGFAVEVPWEQVQVECEKMGVKCVPTFEKFIYTTWEDLMERVEKYYDGPDPVGKSHVREGVVVRIDNRSTFTAYKHKNFSFKVLEGVIKDKADAPDMEEAEELLR